MYNPKFTPESFDGNVTVKRGHHLITDAKGLAMGTLSGKAIYDLAGNKIADMKGKESIKNVEGKDKKGHIYNSDSFGKMCLSEGILYMQGNPIGYLAVRERNITRIAVLLVTALALLATIVLVWMIDLPYSESPIIDIKDSDGEWAAQGTIGVFSDSISPGSSGEYVFILNNPHNQDLLYHFRIKEYFNNEEVTNFPLEFRLKMNNALLETEEWLSADKLHYEDLVILADSNHRFTLEWRWTYENGNDAVDTYFGTAGGKYTLVFDLIAENIAENN